MLIMRRPSSSVSCLVFLLLLLSFPQPTLPQLAFPQTNLPQSNLSFPQPTLPRSTTSFADQLLSAFDWIRGGTVQGRIQGFFLDICRSRLNLKYWLLSINLLLKRVTYITEIEALRMPGDNGFVVNTDTCVDAAISSSAIRTRLQEMMEGLRLGIITRPNNLGLLRFSQQPFTCYTDPSIYSDGYCGIALGMPEADHSQIRPFLDFALGNGGSTAFGAWVDEGTFWNFEDLQLSAAAFLQDRTELRLGPDAGAFFLIQIHKRVLDIDMTETEALDLLQFYADFVQRCTLPDVPIVLNPNGLRERRLQIINQYVTAIGARNHLFGLQESQFRLAAEAFADALGFAAAPALTGATEGALGAYLNGLVDGGIDWSSIHDVGTVVMEVVRVYPPVLGVSYVKDGGRFSSLAGYAGYDQDVWGPNAYFFGIKGNLESYRALQLSWSDAAIPSSDRAFASHVCPAKSLSFNLLVAFLIAMNVPEWVAATGVPPEVNAPGQGPFFWDEFDITRVS